MLMMLLLLLFTDAELEVSELAKLLSLSFSLCKHSLQRMVLFGGNPSPASAGRVVHSVVLRVVLMTTVSPASAGSPATRQFLQEPHPLRGGGEGACLACRRSSKFSVQAYLRKTQGVSIGTNRLGFRNRLESSASTGFCSSLYGCLHMPPFLPPLPLRLPRKRAQKEASLHSFG